MSQPATVGTRLARFVLDRLGYGPRPESIEEVLSRGVERWIDDQLAPGTDAAVESRLRSLSTLDDPIRTTILRLNADPRTLSAALLELQSAHFIRAVHSSRQLEEVLTDFWFNHFNVWMGDLFSSWGLARYEMDTIRPHVLGRFRELLGAVAGSWSMMIYLDNNLNTNHSINENYGRELMELHTLGVEGGYTQQDVTEVARAFTGWGIDLNAGTFLYHNAQHDQAPKTVLGQRLPANQGRKDGEDVLDLLARHPSTARFISRKLCWRFVSDDPPESLVARAAEAFRSTDGDIAQVLRAIVGSPDFFNEAFGAGKIKTPHEYVVSALRAIGADVTSARAFVDSRADNLVAMGMPLYLSEDPTGWSNRGTDWLPNPGSHLARMNFVLGLVSQTADGVSIDLRGLLDGADPGNAAAAADAVNSRVFGGTLPAEVLSACSRVVAGPTLLPAFKVVGLALASPAFQVR